MTPKKSNLVHGRTAAERALAGMVRLEVDVLSAGNFRHRPGLYLSSNHFTWAEGAWWTPCRTRLTQREPKSCYGNAATVAIRNRNYSYCEGLAIVAADLPIPIAHAWLVDKDGRVHENTWDEPGAAYLGVVFRTGYLMNRLAQARVHCPLIDDFRNHWPLLQRAERTRPLWEHPLTAKARAAQAKPADLAPTRTAFNLLNHAART